MVHGSSWNTILQLAERITLIANYAKYLRDALFRRAFTSSLAVSFHWPRNNVNATDRNRISYIPSRISRLRWIYFIKLYAMLIFTFGLAQAFPVLNRIAPRECSPSEHVCVCVCVCVHAVGQRGSRSVIICRVESRTRHYLLVIALSHRLSSPLCSKFVPSSASPPSGDGSIQHRLRKIARWN